MGQSSRSPFSSFFLSVQHSCILYIHSCRLLNTGALSNQGFAGFVYLPLTSFFCHLTPPAHLLPTLAAEIAGRGRVSKPCKVLNCHCNFTNRPTELSPLLTRSDSNLWASRVKPGTHGTFFFRSAQRGALEEVAVLTM